MQSLLDNYIINIFQNIHFCTVICIVKFKAFKIKKLMSSSVLCITQVGKLDESMDTHITDRQLYVRTAESEIFTNICVYFWYIELRVCSWYVKYYVYALKLL